MSLYVSWLLWDDGSNLYRFVYFFFLIGFWGMHFTFVSFWRGLISGGLWALNFTLLTFFTFHLWHFVCDFCLTFLLSRHFIWRAFCSRNLICWRFWFQLISGIVWVFGFWQDFTKFPSFIPGSRVSGQLETFVFYVKWIVCLCSSLGAWRNVCYNSFASTSELFSRICQGFCEIFIWHKPLAYAHSLELFGFHENSHVKIWPYLTLNSFWPGFGQILQRNVGMFWFWRILSWKFS